MYEGLFHSFFSVFTFGRVSWGQNSTMKPWRPSLLMLLAAVANATAIPGPYIDKRITVAFAADTRYLPKLLAVVERLRIGRHGKFHRLIAYNLNAATNVDIERLRCAAPTLLDDVRQFAFQSYPEHVAQLNCYAWKPLIVAQLRR